VNTGAMEPGTGTGRQRQLAGRDGPEEAERVLAEGGVVTRPSAESSDARAFDENRDDNPVQLQGQQAQVHGSTVDQTETQAEQGDEYDAMNIDQLQEVARERGIAGRSTMTKPQLQAALRS
jgi:hypothetical protein